MERRSGLIRYRRNDQIGQMVGEGGLEPPASWSQTRRATKLRHSPAYVLTLSEKLLSERRVLLHELNDVPCVPLVRDDDDQDHLTLHHFQIARGNAAN